MEMKVAVILSETKDLQFRAEANECRFFASLRMTEFRESEARNLALVRTYRKRQAERDSSLRPE
jgi:hypothetical protein